MRENGEARRLLFEIADKNWLERQRKLRALYENHKTRADEQARILSGFYRKELEKDETAH